MKKNNTEKDSTMMTELLYIFDILPSLHYKERYSLLSSIEYRDILKRFFKIIFNRQVIRFVSFNNTKVHKYKIVGADKRFLNFICTHEKFIANKISPKHFNENIKTLLTKLNIKELNFYKKIINGSLLNLDYSEIKKTFFDEKDFLKTFARFNSGFVYSKNMNIDFPVQAQPLLDGIQLKVIGLKKKNKISIFYSNQKKILGMKRLEKAIYKYMKERNLNRIEVDVIALSKDYCRFTLVSNLKKGKFNSIIYYIYDVIINSNNKSESLKRRTHRAKSIASLLKNKDYTNYLAMPSILINNNKELEVAKKMFFSSPMSKGVIIKRVSSIYFKERTTDWLKIYKPLMFENLEIKQFIHTLTWSQKEEVSSIIAKTNSGTDITVKIRESQRKYLTEWQENLHGSFFTASIKDNEIIFERLMPHKNRF